MPLDCSYSVPVSRIARGVMMLATCYNIYKAA